MYKTFGDIKKNICSKIFFTYTVINSLLLIILLAIKDFNEKYNNIYFMVFSTWCTLLLFYLLYEIIKDNYDQTTYYNKQKVAVILIVMIEMVLMYYLFYLGYEKFIRFWDYSCYWGIQIRNTNIFKESVIKGLQTLKNTIYYDEYNSFPTLFLHSIFSLTDKSKWGYILSVFFIYTIPIIVCYSKIFIHNINLGNHTSFYFKYIICMMIVIFCPAMHLPALLGYLDIIGLMFISMILVLIKDYEFSEINAKKMFLIGILLIMLFISRRWYAYWIVSFFISLGISYFITDVVINKQFKDYICRIKNIFIFGIIMLIIIILIFFPLLRRIIESNFTIAYSAYKSGGISYEISEFIKSLGIFPTSIMCFGIFGGVKRKESRNFSLQLVIIPIICIILFNSIQTMGIHHRYLLMASAMYFQGIGCITIIDFFKNNIKRNMVLLSLIIIYVCNFYVSITGKGTRYLFTNLDCKPVKMESYDQNYRMVNFVEDKFDETGEKTYILASSALYNEEIVSCYYMPDLRMQDMVYRTNCVDLRDGFPEQFLTAKYVIVVDPIQYHLRPEDQRTIGILASALLNESLINKHYSIEKVEYGNLGEKIYYFKQESELDNEALEYFVKEFNKYYKEYSDLFEDRIIKYFK